MDRITSLINEFDYLDVMSYAPDGEYENEIDMIQKLVDITTSPYELAKGIQKIFFDNCGEDLNFNKYGFEDFLVLSEKILNDDGTNRDIQRES